MIIAVIPAKSGSLRLKNKNIRILNKKPMIYWSIKYAKKSKLLDKIYVSTNSKKISDLMKKYKIPVIKRPLKLCGETPIMDVYKHSFNRTKKSAKIIVGLQPDHPDRTCDVDYLITSFIKKKADILYSVDKNNIKNGAHYIISKRVLMGKKVKKKIKTLENCTNIHFKKDLKRAEKRIIKLYE
jgi:CMP-N,N'-diacetyllegionaminic acid synthase